MILEESICLANSSCDQPFFSDEFETIWVNSGIQGKVANKESLDRDDIRLLRKMSNCGLEKLDSQVKFNLIKSILAYPIYAVETGDTIKLAGKLNIVSYDPKPINLVVVPVNGASYPYPENSLTTKLQAIFNPAIDSLSVTLADNFDTNEFDGELDEISTNLAQSYTREMKDLFQDFEDNNEILDDTYYIFLLPRFAITDQLGYMPRKRKFGFVNYEQLNTNEEEYVKTIAHELSHGAFVLHHTFVQHPQLIFVRELNKIPRLIVIHSLFMVWSIQNYNKVSAQPSPTKIGSYRLLGIDKIFSIRLSKK